MFESDVRGFDGGEQFLDLTVPWLGRVDTSVEETANGGGEGFEQGRVGAFPGKAGGTSVEVRLKPPPKGTGGEVWVDQALEGIVYVGFLGVGGYTRSPHGM